MSDLLAYQIEDVIALWRELSERNLVTVETETSTQSIDVECEHCEKMTRATVDETTVYKGLGRPSNHSVQEFVEGILRIAKKKVAV